MGDAPSGTRRLELELIARARLGDREAFAQLVRGCQDRLYNACYRMSGNASDALELSQEVLLRAWQGLAGFESRAGFYTWVFRIATNLVFTRRRAARRRHLAPAVVPPGAAEPVERSRSTVASGAAPDAGARLEQREECERVAAALSRIDEQFRWPLILKDIEDMDYAAIARVLDVPLGTVKSRIHRGRMLLRELLLREETSRGPSRLP